MATNNFSSYLTLDQVYPVGSIYISTNSTDPSAIIGGIWESFAQGRTLIGVDSTDTDYEGGGLTGGSKTHTLTTNEMPSHGHTFTGSAINTSDISANHTHTGTSGNPSANHSHSGPSHTHGPNNGANMGFLTADSASNIYGTGWKPCGGAYVGGWGGFWSYAGATTSSGTGSTGTVSAWHTHTTTTGNQSQGHTHSVTAAGTIGNTGSGNSFSLMTPYITVYMWQRIA